MVSGGKRVWRRKTECRTMCPSLAGRAVVFKTQALHQVSALMRRYPTVEWMAYLVGHLVHDEDTHEVLVVESLRFPEQTASWGDVSSEQPRNPATEHGVIHSHHRTGVHGFSTTDRDSLNANNPISVLVNQADNLIGLTMIAEWRVQSECGHTIAVKPTIRADVGADHAWAEMVGVHHHEVDYSPDSGGHYWGGCFG